MNRIILIGNGFDLAHGLKTSYKDFIDDYWERKCKKLLELFGKNIPSEFGTIDIITKYEDEDILVNFPRQTSVLKDPLEQGITGFNRFHSLISKLKNNINTSKLKYKNIFLRKITEKSLVNWVDIEYEYYLAMIECLGRISECKWEGGIEQLNKEFSRIQKALEEYLKTQCVSKNLYSEEISNRIYYPIPRTQYLLNPNEDWERILILNFNYTNTTKLYIYDEPYETNDTELIYIHGELNNPENPIIFGYGDEIDEQSKTIENKNEKEYFANNKSINYLQTNNYQELLAFINADKYEIFIMGHSCGNSDRTLLNTLFEHDNCKKIKPFYYKREDSSDDYNDIVINIYRNFKDKKLCRARVEPRTQCEPLPQSKKSEQKEPPST
jgi:hypothetical protein